jgi:hypothetical protein
MLPGPAKPEAVGLPPRVFLYTLDQVASLIEFDLLRFKTGMVYYDNRSVGAKRSHDLVAINIARPGETPEWRVTEPELIRWLKAKRIRVYLRGWTRS